MRSGLLGHRSFFESVRIRRVKKHIVLVALGLPSGNLVHLLRRSPTSLVRRFSEEFEESLPVLVKTAFCTLEKFLYLFKMLSMFVSPHLHGLVSEVEKLADFLVRFPICLLTRLGAVLDGLALAATVEHGISVAGEAVLGHDSDGGCWCYSSVYLRLELPQKYSRSRSRGREIANACAHETGLV
jgi:hypothetical protein